MKLKIVPEIFEKFGSLAIGVVICKGLDNNGNPEDIQKEIRIQENRIRAGYNAETLSQDPKIGVWRKAYSAFGAKPKENKSSVESLYRAVLKGSNIRHINKLVDIYNLVSLKHMVPVGGEDIDMVKGDVVLEFAGPNEPEVLLLGDNSPRPPHEGEVIYTDYVSAICRRWNWREADRTKLTEKTQNCFLVIEGLAPVARQEIEDAAKELKEMAQNFCGGEASHKILDRHQPEVEL